MREQRTLYEEIIKMIDMLIAAGFVLFTLSLPGIIYFFRSKLKKEKEERIEDLRELRKDLCDHEFDYFNTERVYLINFSYVVKCKKCSMTQSYNIRTLKILQYKKLLENLDVQLYIKKQGEDNDTRNQHNN